MEFSSEKDEKPVYIQTQNYNSIQKVWSDYSQFKQTSAGLNHYRRDVIIADFDATLGEFNEVFNSSGLPKFSYILISLLYKVSIPPGRERQIRNTEDFYEHNFTFI